MGDFGVPELLIIVAVIGIAVGVTLAVRASKKRRPPYPPPGYPPPGYPQRQYPPQQYPPQGPPVQGPYPYPPPQGPHPPQRQGPWR